MFIFIASSIFTLLAGIVLWACLPKALRKYYWIFWALALAVHTLWGLARWGSGTSWSNAPASIAMVFWSVTMVTLDVAGMAYLVMRGIVRGALWMKRRMQVTVDDSRPVAPVNHERRLLLSAAPVAGLSIAASSVAAAGVVSASRPFRVVHEEIPFKGLPPALDGFRIGQLSDVHVADFISPRYLHDAIRALDEAQVDMQVMTGDLIDDLAQLDETFEVLQRNRAAHGMVCILGNHEKRRGHFQPIMDAYRRCGACGVADGGNGKIDCRDSGHGDKSGRLRLLVDQSLRIEHRGAELAVVGVDYPMSSGGNHMPPRDALLMRMEASARAAFADVPDSMPILCLTHHPEFFPLAAARGAGLTLAGHTHGGQCRVRGFSLADEWFDYVLGRYHLGDAHLYVSGGTGHLLPFRIGVPTEVTVLTLHSV